MPLSTTMHSPTTAAAAAQYQAAAGQQRLAQSSSPYFQIALYAAGNVLAVAILLLVWFSWGILAAFQEPLLWAWLCSLSLRDVKRFLVSTARRELQSSSFLVCCAKLAFLPAVIAWQLFEEVRDKLQAKYHELQVTNTTQAGTSSRVHSAGAATGADLLSGAAPADGSTPDSSRHLTTECGPGVLANGHAGAANGTAAAAGAGGPQAAKPKGNTQVLRQRKASAKQQQQPQQQQQQPQKHQRPPLGPRTNNTAAGVRAKGAAPPAAAAAAAAAGARHPPGKKQRAAAGGRQQQQQAGVSRLRQRLLRLQDFIKQLFSGYGFITMELLRFILGGLLPRRPDPPTDSQQRQQQQVHQQQHRHRQQQQQLWPASSSSNSTLSTLASLPGHQPLHSLVPPAYLDLHVASGALGLAGGAGAHLVASPASLAGGAASGDGCGGSCRSECNMPWTPHPHLQQLLLQQQQQQQQGLLPLQLHQQQHQQQGQKARLSSSSSSPSLHTAAAAAATAAANWQPSPRASSSGSDSLLQRGMTVPAAVGACGNNAHSFSGWAGAPQQQQQQQQPGLSRSGSTASCAASQAGAAAAAASGPIGGALQGSMPGPDSMAAAAAGQQPFQQLPSPAAAFSLPSPVGPSLGAAPLPAPALSLGCALAPAHPPDPFSLQGPLGTGYDGSSGTWEGVGAGVRTPTGSVTGGAGGSSPSAVLFKGLLRGIVLYEGYRFVRGFLAAEQSLFMPLLVLGATLAVAGGLPFLLLPISLLKTPPPGGSSTYTHSSSSSSSSTDGCARDAAQPPAGRKGAAAAAASRQQQLRSTLHSPFSEAAQAQSPPAAAAAAAATTQGSKKTFDSSSGSSRVWSCVQQHCGVAWAWAVGVLVRADAGLRSACASGFLDTAVSGLIVVGLILGSVVLSAVLLVQIGDESRQAVVSLNTLVRQKGTEAGLTEGVWSLVQQYEGQLVGMTQYVLQETLPGLSHYVESRASDFLVSHNLSKVLVDWELVRAALKLPADCGDEAKLRLAVQLANSSLAEAQLGQQRQQLQQQLDAQQRRLGELAGHMEALWINGSSSSSAGGAGRSSSSNSSSNASSKVEVSGSNSNSSSISSSGSSSGGGSKGSSVLAQEVLQVQADVERLQEQLHSAVAGHEAASEQLKLAELRLHNCQPAGAGGATAGVAAGLAGAAQGRGLLSNLLGGLPAGKGSAAAAAAGSRPAGATAGTGGGGAAVGEDGAVGHAGGVTHMNPLGHVRGALAAAVRFDFASAGREVAAVLGQLMPEEQPEQQEQDLQQPLQQQQQQEEEQQEGQLLMLEQDQQQTVQDSCGLVAGDDQGQQQALLPGGSGSGALDQQQCPTNHTCSAGRNLTQALASTRPSKTAPAPRKRGAAFAASSAAKGSTTSSSTVSTTTTTSSSSTSTSLVRVARGAAYPLITLLRHVSSLLAAGLGSTTAVALGTGLGVLRLGLGVAKFLVQLGVFASVLYTLLALDIDPVEQLVKLLPVSEASQDRASRAVTKALRGVFVSSLKLAGWHAGFTWLTLRAFGTHFVCTATVASAIVAVLPLVPVYLTALPAVLELVLVRGAAVKGLVLVALHVGAYTFGDDLIYREIEPTLPYLVGLGVFGGMWHFANPLQGVLLGPMVLALLSVGYNLHREMY